MLQPKDLSIINQYCHKTSMQLKRWTYFKGIHI